MLGFALFYARLSYAILPLAPGGKRPHPRLAPHGLKDASRDPEVLTSWWRRAPEAGLGVLPPEQVLVLDIDDPERVGGLIRGYGLENASRQRTPRGGAHLFLRLPPGLGLSATTKALPGVDLRGLGRAYLVAAPTRLRTGAYRWEVPLRPPDDLPQAPEGLLKALLPPPPPPRTLGGWTGASPRRLAALLEAYCQRVARTPEGARHTTLIRYARAAGGLLPHGLAFEEALEALTRAGMQAGLPEREAREAARWGLEIGRASPLDLSSTPGFVLTWCELKSASSWTAFSRFVLKGQHRRSGWGREGGDPWQ